MISSRFALACTAAAMGVFAALPASASEILTPGVVGCINLKAAKQYASYTETAPNFARDLLDRATCYVNKDRAEVVKLSEVDGYAQYKLLTGHRVWIVPGTGPVAQPKAVN